ncbi:MAG: hypothetical protein ABI024_06690 [Vicinamibacterales bacterium]
MTPQLLTRGVVIVSTVVAALAEAYLATNAPPVLWLAIGGFILMVIAGSRLRAGALPLLMAAMYLTPAIYLAWRGGEDFSLDSIWILPLLGLVLSGPGVWQWSLPLRWQWPLITWSVLVSITWPIVFLREADFALWILPLERVSNTSIGISPWQVGLNVTYFAVGHNLGILWLDALCRWYADAAEHFRRHVILALAAATTIACVIAVYQGFVDLTFLNRPFWSYMLRASGTLGDANKLGAVIAFWTVGAMVLARRWSSPWSTVVFFAAPMLGIATVWVSGSRTGLVAVAVSLAIALIEAFRHWRAARSSRIKIKRVAGITAVAIVVIVGMVVVLQRASTHTVLQRGSLNYVPFIGEYGIANSLNILLWERFGYGPAAIQMIKEHPVDGIGVGAFHALVIDYGKTRGYSIPPDNGQAWLRHNLAEFGVLGSIPMLWWSVVFVMALFARRSGGDRLTTGMLRGVFVGFAIASTFGMPAQSIAIVITFWVFVFWFLIEQAPSASDVVGRQPVTWRRPTVIAAVAVILIHAGMTTADAFGDLRPRERAQRWDWFYRYGFVHPDDVEPDPGGNPVGRRWTTKQSLAVIPVKGRVLKFVAWVDHPDADTNPVQVRVWADSALLYEGDMKRSPLFLDIPATPGEKYMVLETSIDRLFRPSDSGGRDRRELGLSIRDWVWE